MIPEKQSCKSSIIRFKRYDCFNFGLIHCPKWVPSQMKEKNEKFFVSELEGRIFLVGLSGEISIKYFPLYHK